MYYAPPAGQQPSGPYVYPPQQYPPTQPPQAPGQPYTYAPQAQPPYQQPNPYYPPPAANPPAPAQPQPAAYAAPAAPPQQQPAAPSTAATFDLDDLLDIGRAPKTAGTSNIPPPPAYPPPPPVNHDPFGFQQAPAAPAPFVAAPQQYAPQPAPGYGTAPVPGYAMQHQYGAPQDAAPPLPVPGPAAALAAPQQQPQWMAQPVADPSVRPYTYPPAQPSAMQPTAVPTAPPTGLGFSHPALQTPGGATYLTPAVQQQPGALSQEEQDRAHLEQIIRLRKELEKEHEKERQKKEEKETWQCATCTYRNKLETYKCDMCEAPRPGFASRPPASAPAVATPQQQPPPPQASKNNWTCPTCYCVNSDAANICKVCGTNIAKAQSAAPNAPPSTVRAAPVPSNVWECPQCTLQNPLTANQCQACLLARPAGAAPPQPTPIAPPPNIAQQLPSQSGQWGCTQCTFHNPPTAVKCSMCDTPRPGAPPSMMVPAYSQNSSRSTAQAPPQRGTPPAQSTRPAPADEDDEDDVQWQDDKAVVQCNKCKAAFGLLVRRHHCRACGFVFCANCSANKVRNKAGKLNRVCVDCFRERVDPTPAPQPRSPAPGQSAYPGQSILSQPAQPSVVAVNCDCAMGSEGFHRPNCVYRRR